MINGVTHLEELCIRCEYILIMGIGVVLENAIDWVSFGHKFIFLAKINTQTVGSHSKLYYTRKFIGLSKKTKCPQIQFIIEGSNIECVIEMRKINWYFWYGKKFDFQQFEIFNSEATKWTGLSPIIMAAAAVYRNNINWIRRDNVTLEVDKRWRLNLLRKKESVRAKE